VGRETLPAAVALSRVASVLDRTHSHDGSARNFVRRALRKREDRAHVDLAEDKRIAALIGLLFATDRDARKLNAIDPRVQ
jgi:hypothetical protein